MRIGGLQKISLIDFPGIVSAVVFTQGCNFRCPYCHNADLVLPELFIDPLSEEEIFQFLEDRVGKLKGVVLSGGEPTIQTDLICFIQKIKNLKYAVKLDTNGSQPEVLKCLLENHLLDYVAMDVKASEQNYPKLTGCAVDIKKIEESISLMRQADIPYEFRTTFVKSLHEDKEFLKIFSMIKGARQFVAQGFEPRVKILDKGLLQNDYFSQEDIREIQSYWEKNCSTGLKK